MIFLLKKKWDWLILAGYFFVAVTGTFSFSIAEPFRSIDLLEDNPVLSGSFASINTSIDYLAENVIITGKAQGRSFSPLGNGIMRIVMLLKKQNAGAVLSQSSIKTIEDSKYLNIKSTIVLKLRI
jgi:hypothetical protein